MLQQSDRQFWFAVQAKSNCEKVASVALKNRGYREFLPVYEVRRPWADRIKTLSLPLFPGYVFCRFAPCERALVLDTPGVYGVVCVGKIPAPIDENEITALQTVVGSGGSAEPWPFLNVGARVRIAYGPLRGLQGILIQTKQQNRLVLSATLLHRSVAVEVDRSWIERAA